MDVEFLRFTPKNDCINRSLHDTRIGISSSIELDKKLSKEGDYYIYRESISAIVTTNRDLGV